MDGSQVLCVNRALGCCCLLYSAIGCQTVGLGIHRSVTCLLYSCHDHSISGLEGIPTHRPCCTGGNVWWACHGNKILRHSYGTNHCAWCSSVLKKKRHSSGFIHGNHGHKGSYHRSCCCLAMVPQELDFDWKSSLSLLVFPFWWTGMVTGNGQDVCNVSVLCWKRTRDLELSQTPVGYLFCWRRYPS